MVLTMWIAEEIATINIVNVSTTAYTIRSDFFRKVNPLEEDSSTPQTGNKPKNWATTSIRPIAQWKLSGSWSDERMLDTITGFWLKEIPLLRFKN